MDLQRSFVLKLGVAVFLFLSVSEAKPSSGMEEEWESKTYAMGAFSELFLEGSFKVYLIQGDKPLLEVKVSDPKAFDYLNISNKNRSLHIHVDRKPFDLSRISLYITFKTLDQLRIKGGVKLETRGYLNLDDFFVHLEGGANIKCQTKGRHIAVKSEGGGLFELDGVSESLDVHIAGAGHVDAGEMKSKKVTFLIEGVGTGNVYATQLLDAKIYGAGKIRYRGNPRVTEHIEGLGSVKRQHPN